MNASLPRGSGAGVGGIDHQRVQAPAPRNTAGQPRGAGHRDARTCGVGDPTGTITASAAAKTCARRPVGLVGGWWSDVDGVMKEMMSGRGKGENVGKSGVSPDLKTRNADAAPVLMPGVRRTRGARPCVSMRQRGAAAALHRAVARGALADSRCQSFRHAAGRLATPMFFSFVADSARRAPGASFNGLVDLRQDHALALRGLPS